MGPLPGTTMTRYAVLHGEHTVWQVQVSRPDGVEVPQPTNLRWRHAPAVADVKVWTVPAWNARGPLTPERHNGERRVSRELRLVRGEDAAGRLDPCQRRRVGLLEVPEPDGREVRGDEKGEEVIRLLWLRWLSSALRRQESGLRAELAGVEYMLRKNAADQRRVAAQLAMAETERRYRVAR